MGHFSVEINSDCNERYYDLIQEFGKLSGHPVVLNTSFNVMDEPIVASPYDAVRCFYSTGIDVLYIGDCVVEKHRAQSISPGLGLRTAPSHVHGDAHLV